MWWFWLSYISGWFLSHLKTYAWKVPHTWQILLKSGTLWISPYCKWLFCGIVLASSTIIWRLEIHFWLCQWFTARYFTNFCTTWCGTNIKRLLIQKLFGLIVWLKRWFLVTLTSIFPNWDLCLPGALERLR